MTDSYVGCDQEQEVEFDVEGDMREWGVCCPKQCTIAKAVSPEGGACRLFQKNTSKRIEAPAGVSSKMTNLFHFHIKSTRIMSTELPKISTGLPPEDTLNDEERLRIRKNCRNLMSYPNTCSHECRYPSSESGDCSSPCWQLGRAVQASSPSSPYLPVIPLSAFVTVYYYGSANCVISFVCLSSNQVFTMRKLVMKATDGGAYWCRQRGRG